ncbi:MAG: hypothetical protein KGJ86_04980, partial [Chloroflexota bacterium]|nr:hypothetical protein [Chloroflexota bacterium]
EIMGGVLQRGLVDVGFLGALEVDKHGNANSTEVPRPDGTIRRFNGSGGANDMAALAKTTIIIIRHEPRKLVERVSHLTSAGFLSSPDGRKAVGLPGGGPSRVLTDKVVFGFNPSTGTLQLRSIHPGVTHDDLRASTGFALDVPAGCPTTPPPTDEQLRIIREELDPDQQYTVRP